MGTRIFVGNLAYGSTEESIGQHFEQFGLALKSARIIIDRDTGRSRGFAFVELADESQMERAVRELDGSMLEGRPLAVREAHDKPGPGPGGPRPSFGGPRGGYGGGGPAVESRRSFGDSSPPRPDRGDGAPSDVGDSRPPRDSGFGAPRGGGYGGGGYGGGDRGGGPGGGFGGGGFGGGGGYGGGPGGGAPGGGGYGGGGGAPRGGYGGGPSRPSGGFGGPPRPGGPGGAQGKRKPQRRDDEGASARKGDGESGRRRGFHGGRGYTEYEDDDD